MAPATISMKDGTQLHLRMAGNGPPLLLLHGWAVSGALFDAQIAELAKTHTVICPDMRGHGASETGPQRPLSISLLASDIAELIALLGLKDVCLVGWSMGAMVAWEAIRLNPDLPVTSLVIIDMAPKLGNAEGWTLGLIRDGDNAAAPLRRDWPATVHKFVPRIFAPDYAQTHADQIAEVTTIAEGNPAAPLAELWHSMVGQDFRIALSAITLPSLIIHGAKSQLYPAATAQFIAAQMPNSELVTFKNSGHAPHVEEAALFNRTLTGFSFRVSGKENANNVAHA